MVKTRNLVIGIGLAVFLLVGVFAFSDGFGLLSTFGECSGGQVLSVDDVSIRTSSDLGGRQVIRVLFSSIPSAECLDIDLTESQIENELNRDDFKVTDSILGDIDLTKKNIEFGVNVRSTEKFIRFAEKDLGKQLLCLDSDCRNAGVTNLVASVKDEGFFSTQCTCVSLDIQAVNGEFTSGSSLKWEADVSIGGRSVTLNNGKTSGKIGNIAFVKWAGNLAGNIGFSSPNRDALQSTTTNQFSMIEDGAFRELERKRNNVINALVSCDFRGDKECPDELTSARQYNARFDQLTGNDLGSWISGEFAVADALFSGSKLIVDLNSPIVYPQFTLDIVAEEVGIFITEGEPEVECPDNFEIISGDTFSAKAKVINEGSGSGSFSYFVECDAGSQFVSPSPPVNIGKGQSRTVTVTSGGISESGKERVVCTFTAVETNTLKEDSCSFGYSIEAREDCIKGQKSCELGNSELWECLGGGEFKKTDCSFGCEAFGSSFRCRLQPEEICDNGIDDNGDGLVDDDDPECKGLFSDLWKKFLNFWKNLFAGIFGVFFAVKLLIVFIGVLFSTLLSKGILGDTRALANRNGIQWIIALIIGILFGVILFLFIGSFWFWVLLIGGILVLSFWNRIKGVFGR